MPAVSYKAGAASVCITPSEPQWLAGYASRVAPARGKISDLYASALVLEDDRGQQFVIASLDLIAVTPILSEPIVTAVQARFGVAKERILLTATHTHCAPEFRPDKQHFFKIPPEFAAKLPTVSSELAAATVSAIGRALEQLEPVRLFVRTTSVGFAHNRRRHGIVAGAPSTEDFVDHDLTILDCVDTKEIRKAIVFSYACHLTTIPPDDGRYCGDWAGFAKEQLERAYPECTALFVPGAGADQDPEPNGSIELSKQHGRLTADAIQQALDAPAVEISGPIRAAGTSVELPLRPVTESQLAEMMASNDPPQQAKAYFLHDALQRGEQLITSYFAPLQAVKFGNELLLIALSGEPVVDWSHKLKNEFGANVRPRVWIAGYCNDMFGYLPTRRVQSEGGYEGGRANLWNWIPAPFTDEVEERVSDAIRLLVSQVSM